MRARNRVPHGVEQLWSANRCFKTVEKSEGDSKVLIQGEFDSKTGAVDGQVAVLSPATFRLTCTAKELWFEDPCSQKLRLIHLAHEIIHNRDRGNLR